MARIDLTNEDLDAIDKDPYALIPLVLEEVNDIRKVCLIGEGKLDALPKGIVKNAEECVLARALSNGWNAKVYEEQIELTHEKPDSVDYDKMLGELEELGYSARHYPFDDEDGTPSIEIQHTEVTGMFIEHFDYSQYPDLILAG